MGVEERKNNEITGITTSKIGLMGAIFKAKSTVFLFTEIKRTLISKGKIMKLFAFTMLIAASLVQNVFADSWSSVNFTTVTEVAWNIPGHKLEVQCKKPDGGDYQYKYDWNATGASLEHAKILLSMILTAQSTGKGFNIYGDHAGNGVAITWNNFSAFSIK